MNIVVLSGSSRTGSNSGILTDYFQKGYEEADYRIFSFGTALGKVYGCMGRDHCDMKGLRTCEDGFTPSREPPIDADLVLFASAMHYSGMSARPKAVKDSFQVMGRRIMGGRPARQPRLEAKTEIRNSVLWKAAKICYPVCAGQRGNYAGRWSNCGKGSAPRHFP